MPMLSNARHERFAQALAAGKTADEAYQEAGYKPSRPHASRLATKGNVKERLAELLGRATEGIVLTRQWVIEELVANAKAAKARQDGSVVNRALELLGKEIGMFVDRAEIDQTTKVISDKPQTDEEWEATYSTRGAGHLAATNGAAESAESTH